jgi:pSer/pThr/pTyr-binding forkhead associated (FHA) protein
MPRIVVTIPDKNAQPYRFQLDTQAVTIGRGPDNDIVTECGSISIHHAEMRRVKGGYELCDLGSTNGILLDGARYNVIPLENGLDVKIGDATFEFTLTDTESETLARELKPEPTITPLLKPAASFDEPFSKNDTYQPAESSSVGFGTILIGLILISSAFLAGLYLRHQKETGGSLIEAVKNKNAQLQSPTRR